MEQIRDLIDWMKNLISFGIYEYQVKAIDREGSIWTLPVYDLKEARTKIKHIAIEFENILENTWIERRNRFGWKWKKINE